MSQSHAPTPPPASISFELSPKCNLLPLSLSLREAQTASHTVMIHPLSLFLSLCPPAGFSCSDYCLYVQKTQPGVGRMYNPGRHRFIVSRSLSLTHKNVHGCKRLRWLSKELWESGTVRSPFSHFFLSIKDKSSDIPIIMSKECLERSTPVISLF